MAQGKDKAGTNGASSASPPAGFRRISAVRNAPWYAVEAGNACHGNLVGDLFTMATNPPRDYYQVELLAACKARKGKGDDVELVDVPAGTIVNLGETFQMRVLRDQVARVKAGGIVHIWINPKGKIKLEKGRTMWDIEVLANEIKAPTSKVQPVGAGNTSAEGGGSEDSVPF